MDLVTGVTLAGHEKRGEADDLLIDGYVGISDGFPIACKPHSRANRKYSQLDIHIIHYSLLPDGSPRFGGVDDRKRTGFSLDELAGPKLGELVALGMLTDDGVSVKLTRDGLMIADAIGPALL